MLTSSTIWNGHLVVFRGNVAVGGDRGPNSQYPHSLQGISPWNGIILNCVRNRSKISVRFTPALAKTTRELPSRSLSILKGSRKLRAVPSFQ